MTSTDSAALNQQLATLLPKCSRSDYQAFTDVYNLASPHLYAVIVRALGKNAEAEQALGDTFLEIWSRCSEYRSDQDQPMTWLTGIARGQAARALQEQSFKKAANGSGVSVGGSMQTELDGGAFQNENAESQTLKTCLERLDEQPGDCLVRAYAQGLSLDELSELHDTPVDNIKSWIRSGLLSVKECVNANA